MKIRVFESPAEACHAAAVLIAAQLLKKPKSILGLATGSSPIPCYQHLIKLNEEGVIDFSRVTSYNLDEYVAISEEHPESYHAFMKRNLFDHVNIDQAKTHVPSGLAEDLAAAGKAYDAEIAEAGGIDLQLLGIGRNGHIGFNEPSDSFTLETHVVDLTESTIEANKRFFASADEVPKQAITMGMGTIMDARTVVLIATGADKAEAVRDAVEGPVTPELPASILQNHDRVYFLLDKAAASLLQGKK